MKSKRQTTRAKLERERLVRERRALKQERKQAAAAARDDAVARPIDDTISVDPGGSSARVSGEDDRRAEFSANAGELG